MCGLFEVTKKRVLVFSFLTTVSFFFLLLIIVVRNLDLDLYSEISVIAILVVLLICILSVTLKFFNGRKDPTMVPTLTEEEFNALARNFMVNSRAGFDHRFHYLFPRAHLRQELGLPPPPSYERCAHEQRETRESEAPPAYNQLQPTMSSSSPPPFYRSELVERALAPFSPRSSRSGLPRYESVVTETRRSSFESTSTERIPTPTLARSSAVSSEPESPSTSSVSTSPLRIAPKRKTGRLAQIMIDCSKAEPSIFTITRGESMI